jgi:D-alanyl-D-alanine-carboxypeptidase/D-alanyl-D-alanine-endopeptidase
MSLKINSFGAFRRRLIALVTIVSPFTPLYAQGWLNDDAVNAGLRERVASKRAVGIVVAALEKGKPPTFYVAGASGAAVALDRNTVFEIGSVTKVFTTAVLAEMIQRGEVRLDDPISKYLPATVRVPSRNGRQITLLDLATQTSGLPRLPSNLNVTSMVNPYANYTVQQLYEFLSGHQLSRDIGSKFEYSNLGMGLLGHVLAIRAGESYETLVTERILVPLGMGDTHITLTPALRARLAPGHDDADTVVSNWDIPTLAGAGALRSTASDMLKFLAANLDSSLGPVARALAVAHVPLRDTDSQRMRIGLAWITITPFDTPLVWHNGQTGGYHSFIGFDPARSRGVVVLANSSKNVDDIGLHLLDARVPLSAPPKVRTEIQINPALLDAYVGVYELAPSFRLAVTREGNSLFGQATGQSKFQLFPETETDFFWKVVDAQVTFVKDAAGKVNQIVLHQGGANIPGKRVQ